MWSVSPSLERIDELWVMFARKREDGATLLIQKPVDVKRDKQSSRAKR